MSTSSPRRSLSSPTMTSKNSGYTEWKVLAVNSSRTDTFENIGLTQESLKSSGSSKCWPSLVVHWFIMIEPAAVSARRTAAPSARSIRRRITLSSSYVAWTSNQWRQQLENPAAREAERPFIDGTDLPPSTKEHSPSTTPTTPALFSASGRIGYGPFRPYLKHSFSNREMNSRFPLSENGSLLDKVYRNLSLPALDCRRSPGKALPLQLD
mmetsp:Transcript_16629/g.45261  ORF Transcript_16629/g.45261 Transcript_16629/m.45261 type:complete len:210 (+) Transcript_16629:1143-1772(+)